MRQAVQDASIHPSQGGLSGKTTLQGQPGSGGAPNRLLRSRHALVRAGCEQWEQPP